MSVTFESYEFIARYYGVNFINSLVDYLRINNFMISDMVKLLKKMEIDTKIAMALIYRHR